MLKLSEYLTCCISTIYFTYVYFVKMYLSAHKIQVVMQVINCVFPRQNQVILRRFCHSRRKILRYLDVHCGITSSSGTNAQILLRPGGQEIHEENGHRRFLRGKSAVLMPWFHTV